MVARGGWRRSEWAAYAAGTWALAFAASHLCEALGDHGSAAGHECGYEPGLVRDRRRRRTLYVEAPKHMWVDGSRGRAILRIAVGRKESTAMPPLTVIAKLKAKNGSEEQLYELLRGLTERPGRRRGA